MTLRGPHFNRFREQHPRDDFGGHDFEESGLFIHVDEDGNETHEKAPVVDDRIKRTRQGATMVIRLDPGHPIRVERPSQDN